MQCRVCEDISNARFQELAQVIPRLLLNIKLESLSTAFVLSFREQQRIFSTAFSSCSFVWKAVGNQQAERNWPNPRVLLKFVWPPQLQMSCYHAFLVVGQAWKLKASFLFVLLRNDASNIISVPALFFFLFHLGIFRAVKGNTSVVMSPVYTACQFGIHWLYLL